MMNTDITVRSNATQLSPWGDFANDHLASAIAGDLLTFAKGDWRRGEAKKEIGQNETFLCNMVEIWTGWIRWEDGAAVEQSSTSPRASHATSSATQTRASGRPISQATRKILGARRIA